MSPSTETKDCCMTRRGGRGLTPASFMGVFLPSALLLLVPKCPLCIVAYAEAATGIGISAATASEARLFVIVGCICLLVFSVFRIFRRGGMSVSVKAAGDRG